jgi:GTPase
MKEMEANLPDLPYVFISSVSGLGIQRLKDMLWARLNQTNEAINND